MTDLMPELDNETILPDGYGENDDFFDVDSWGTDDRASENLPDEEGDTDDSGSVEKQPEPETPNTGEQGVEEDQSTEEVDEDASQGQEKQTETPKRNIRFTARIDHEDVDVDLDEKDLPEIYQKAQVVDRLQAKMANQKDTSEKMRRLAKAMGYENTEAMLNSAEENFRNNKIDELMEGNNLPREIAEDYVNRLLQRAQDVPSEKETWSSDKDDAPNDENRQPDYNKQVKEFYEAYPEMIGKDLPPSVLEQSRNGVNLTRAYGKYLLDAQKAELSKTQNENKILKQNQSSAQKAPVKGVTGGGATDTKPRDAFEEGFDSYFN